ncbi:hypothetical protein AAZX31_12G144400 [Glycine max]|nr:hypothetical protein GLYMA_12G156466v4 [Glycine max]KAH1143366.1 hypothetical protein GYH30_033870 [Glycine max]
MNHQRKIQFRINKTRKINSQCHRLHSNSHSVQAPLTKHSPLNSLNPRKIKPSNFLPSPKLETLHEPLITSTSMIKAIKIQNFHFTHLIRLKILPSHDLNLANQTRMVSRNVSHKHSDHQSCKQNKEKKNSFLWSPKLETLHEPLTTKIHMIKSIKIQTFHSLASSYSKSLPPMI